jgi:transaldolase / glucose-6-phosphate isomerase
MSFNSLIRGLFARDASIWADDPIVQKKISNRLGWLDAPQFVADQMEAINSFADQIRDAGFQHIVLLAMGGSCLAPEVMARIAGEQVGWPRLRALDSTSPDKIGNIEEELNLATTLFVVASKSGNTIETHSLYLYFRQQLLDAGLPPGDYMVAITDSGSNLETVAAADGFRACFINPADIGGRYSAVSYFGLVPAALIGINIRSVVATAMQAIAECQAGTGRGVRLGEWMGRNWQLGRDKMGMVLSSDIEPFGWWIEQLVAESLGKQGKGILPWRAEMPGSSYPDDMFFAVWSKSEIREDLRMMHQGALQTVAQLGAEFVHWEVATALAGAVLDVNPFDEPNVTEAKQVTSKILAEGVENMGSVGAPVSSLVSQLGPKDYLNILAYLPDTTAVKLSLEGLIKKIRDLTSRPVILSWGPRYLHSSGQLHKGGPNQGVFLVLAGDAGSDKAIPEQTYGFRTLLLAQAQGDFKVLQERNRRVTYIKISGDMTGDLENLLI